MTSAGVDTNRNYAGGVAQRCQATGVPRSPAGRWHFPRRPTSWGLRYALAGLVSILLMVPVWAETYTYRLVYQDSTKTWLPVVHASTGAFTVPQAIHRQEAATAFGVPLEDVQVYEWASDRDVREKLASVIRDGTLPSLPAGAPVLSGRAALPVSATTKEEQAESDAKALLESKGFAGSEAKDLLKHLRRMGL